MNKIITIGREFGSGGRELGRKLAEKLGYDYYDKEIVTEIAKRTSFSEKYVHQVIENNPHDLFPITVAHTFSYIDSYSMQQKHTIFNMQEEVIKEMAGKSNCVIVGRCADYILRELKPYKIFVYADMQSKIDRCKTRDEHHDCDNEKKLIKKIKRIDKNRAKYYGFYTGLKWGNKLDYDMCLNTSNQDLDKVATHLAEMLK